ncbi:hypothetical protein TeGR_g4110 [Tetraparma gracilis]|uniref:Eukaryotic translation initiation factor 3 30 kDa subunit n=1 Tax=Tetraparma gracilis TaxID=2962635 RepID=A0ABQ6N0J6_9STRA|nr:hypothetical protein TeGR_g4110 [Tetraparma gracilis]
MADNWDDASDDDWDVAGDDLALPTTKAPAAAWDDEEEDLAVKEKAKAEAAEAQAFKKKGNALLDKKLAEKAKKEEEELALKEMRIEAEIEAGMTPDERKAKMRQREEADAAAMADDLFGGGGADGGVGSAPASGGGAAAAAGDAVVLKDLKDYLKHARKVAAALKAGKSAYAASFMRELVQEARDALSEDDISDITKALGVIKNEKIQAAKRRVKGAASKSKAKDKAAEAKAKKIQKELAGDNDRYDAHDEFGAQYEDDFF